MRPDPGSTDIPPMRMSFPADPMGVRIALGEAKESWSDIGVDPDLGARAEQVLAEVMNNIVEHAFRERVDGVIDIEVRPTPNGMICTVQDDGLPMPGNRIPSGELAPISETLDALPEGGFGWFMIRTLTRDLSYDREGDFNRLRFLVPLEPDAAFS